MKNETQQLIDYIKSVIQTCEDADRKAIAEIKAKEDYVPCPMKDGYSRKFDFDYLDGAYHSHEIRGHFEYYDTGLRHFRGFKHETKKFPLPSIGFLTKEEYENEMAPALTSWLKEKVQNEPFGGLYSAEFQLFLLIENDDRNHKGVRTGITVTDQKRKEAKLEMIRAFVKDKGYEAMDVRSREFGPVLKDIFHCIPKFFGELPTEILKDAISTIAQKRIEAGSWGVGIEVLSPLAGACYSVLKKGGIFEYDYVTSDDIPGEQLDFLCWIALQIIRYADDTHDREQGEEILNLAALKGFARAKDYLKFGTGNVGKEYTHLKTPKFEAVANDIKRLIEFKVKAEDAESYGGMLDFIVELLKQGFPADYQIKINSKLKNPIPVSALNKKSKTNLFFGNAAAFPDLWGKMAEYVRTVFDPYTYHSDSSDDEAVTVGGYAVYALGVSDMEANRQIVKEFMDKVDMEHDCTAQCFAEEYMDE